jgi:hypothetical protein
MTLLDASVLTSSCGLSSCPPSSGSALPDSQARPPPGRYSRILHFGSSWRVFLSEKFAICALAPEAGHAIALAGSTRPVRPRGSIPWTLP